MPLPGAGPLAPIPPCTSCGGSSPTGKRPSSVAVGAMPLDASRYPPSPCSHKSFPPLGGFSLQVSLCFGSNSIHSHALLDSGASSCFIDISFFCAHHIPTVPTSQPISVEAIDGRVLSSGAVTEATIPLVLQVGPHHEVLTFYLISTPPSDCFGLILVGDTQSDSGLVQPLHHFSSTADSGWVTRLY